MECGEPQSFVLQFCYLIYWMHINYAFMQNEIQIRVSLRGKIVVPIATSPSARCTRIVAVHFIKYAAGIMNFV